MSAQIERKAEEKRSERVDFYAVFMTINCPAKASVVLNVVGKFIHPSLFGTNIHPDKAKL